MSATSTAIAPHTQLERVVTNLRPGDWVRVDLKHTPTAQVGLVRKSRNHVIRTESTMLFLDTDAAPVLRDSLGKPGHLVRAVEVLDQSTAAFNDEERYDLLAGLMREYTDLVMARRVVERDTAAAFLIEQDVIALKARIEQLLSGWFGGAL